VYRGNNHEDAHSSELGVRDYDLMVYNAFGLDRYEANCRRQLEMFVNGR